MDAEARPRHRDRGRLARDDPLEVVRDGDEQMFGDGVILSGVAQLVEHIPADVLLVVRFHVRVCVLACGSRDDV